MEGIVLWYDSKKGYGFVTGSDGNDYFINRSNINLPLIVRRLRKGQTVRFEPAPGHPNPRAVSVELVGPALNDEKHSQSLPLKKNPFTPQDPVTDPKKFAGRREILRNAVDALYNNKNVLITGPRGIGKSSLAYQLLYMTQGEADLFQRLGLGTIENEFGYLSGDHRCTTGNTLSDIVMSLLSTYAQSAGFTSLPDAKQSTSGFDLKFFKHMEESSVKPIAPSDISNWFVAQVTNIYRSIKNPAAGMSFLIDEADALDETIPLGSFLKATVEKFRLDGFLSVCFIVSGVTGTVTSLIAQHPSSSRLFEKVELQRMSHEELKEVIELTLDGTGVSIAPLAAERLIALANQFPQPLHLLGYHAFRLDEDQSINLGDLENAKNYIVRYALRQDYEDKLRTVSKGVMKDVMKVIAGVSDPSITPKYLQKRMPELSFYGTIEALNTLVQNEILERQGSVYFYKDPLFNIYCRWVFGLESE